MRTQVREILELMLFGLGLGANAVIWASYLLMKWSKPKPRAQRWNGKGIV